MTGVHPRTPCYPAIPSPLGIDRSVTTGEGEGRGTRAKKRQTQRNHYLANSFKYEHYSRCVRFLIFGVRNDAPETSEYSGTSNFPKTSNSPKTFKKNFQNLPKTSYLINCNFGIVGAVASMRPHPLEATRGYRRKPLTRRLRLSKAEDTNTNAGPPSLPHQSPPELVFNRTLQARQCCLSSLCHMFPRCASITSGFHSLLRFYASMFRFHSSVPTFPSCETFFTLVHETHRSDRMVRCSVLPFDGGVARTNSAALLHRCIATSLVYNKYSTMIRYGSY